MLIPRGSRFMRVALHQLRRDANVADVDHAEVGFGGRPCKADFHGGERAGVIGADGVGGGLAGVAVEAAGEIDGEFLRGLCVHPIDGRVERRAWFAAGARAE